MAKSSTLTSIVALVAGLGLGYLIGKGALFQQSMDYRSAEIRYERIDNTYNTKSLYDIVDYKL